METTAPAPPPEERPFVVPCATLAWSIGQAQDYAYFSFDDDVTRAAATADPVGFVGDLPGLVILDEVQRVPTIFTALKSVVYRRAGKYQHCCSKD